jgi:hypothetical protein
MASVIRGLIERFLEVEAVRSPAKDVGAAEVR